MKINGLAFNNSHEGGARRRRVRWGLLSALALLVPVLSVTSEAHAQSPSPNSYFEDWAPSSVNYSANNGVIIEGLGMFGGCAYSLSSVEAATVASINAGKATISEISLQTGCASIGTYEGAFVSLINYVEANASRASSLWGGIMLDEEPGYGFSVSALEGMNAYLADRVYAEPGVTTWYNEIGGNYYKTDYTDLVSGTYNGQTHLHSINAPQIYNSNFATLAQKYGVGNQMVTYSPSNASPWNSPSYAAAQLTGAPYNQQFGTTHNFQWENEFIGR